MFFQRRRLQVLLSLLVIVIASAYLGGELLEAPEDEGILLTGHQSQLFEAFYLLRNRYLYPLQEAPLLEAAVAAVREEALARGLTTDRLPDWSALPKAPGDAGLRRVQSYIDRVGTLEPARFSHEAAVYTALAGMTESLSDPYTLAMDPETFARFNQGLHSHLIGGLGLQVEWSRGAYVVFEVLPQTPAAKAGIRPGDQLQAIDKVPLYGPGLPTEPFESVRFLLKGEVGSAVELQLVRDGAPFTRKLVRETFESRSVTHRLLGDSTSDAPLVGWIRVESLGESTGHELAEALSALTAAGATGFVLDLRDNVGGYLNATVEIASLFLPSGQPVIFTEGRAGKRSQQTIGSKPEQRPLVVLVNERTASSAELLAGALQDYQRARVVGEPTFGKASVQSVHDFSDGGGFKMTTAIYLTPKHRLLEGRGLQPDERVEVEPARDEEAIKEDVLRIYDELWIAKTKRSNS